MSSPFVSTTRLDTNSNYVFDSFPSTTNDGGKYQKAMFGPVVNTAIPTITSQQVYDCVPPFTSAPVSAMENLSIQPMSNEWISPLTVGYNQQEMNYLFAYDDVDLGTSEKDAMIQRSIPSESSSINEDRNNGIEIGQPGTPSSIKGPAEPYRRFSVCSSSHDTQHHQQQQQQPFFDYSETYVPQQQQPIHKERSSMPNVFIDHQMYKPEIPQMTWNQSGFLEGKPMTEDMAKNLYSNCFLSCSNFTTSSLKQAKKRPMVDETYTVPVSSISEPIPTSAHWMQQQQRKRTKSTMDNHGTTNESIAHENYMLSPNDYLPPSTTYDHGNQALAAMPRRQKLRYEGDHYTPKWVRYTGHLKEGYCESCDPGKWLQLKNSAYWYHKQFYHGISSVSGKPFMKPSEQRMGKGDMIEGLCHQCHRFVPACNGKKKNNYMLWYRHAHKCHLYDKPKVGATTSSTKIMRKSSITSNASSTTNN